MSKVARRRKVEGVKPKISRGLPIRAKLKCVDNTGAKLLMIIGVHGYKGRKDRVPTASVGDMVSVVVKKGRYDLMHKPFKAIVVRQRMPYRRKNGQWIVFEDNAAVLVNDDGTPRGSEFRGPVAKEAIERWPSLSVVSAQVV
ncbi:MAG: 50S ribosomal protein L14 [Candidatus Korarchaeum sp.]|nr:50S ribosomal protein L14 [Candidatus Korarchaeum sp.]MDW8035453.1 50S ribosomal protein L14 [Candidatus Korarchaeum sp.]